MGDDILKSKFPEVEPAAEKTLPEYYLAKAKYYAELGRDVWLEDGLTGERRYFRKFEEETRKIASALHKLGVRKGDVVIYMIRDLCKLHILINGVWRANGIIRATYIEDDADTILSRVVESAVKVIVCQEDAIPRIKEVSERAQTEIAIVTTKRNNLGLPSLEQFLEEDDGSDCPDILLTENDPVAIFCTSGTTGLPKGAVHTHRSLLQQLRVLERIPFTLDQVNLMCSNATHVSGTTFALLLLGTGKTGIILSNPTLENFLIAAAKYKPGFIFAFPTFLVPMAGPEGAGYDLSSVKIILTGATPITPAIRTAIFKLPNVTDIITAYGLTEVMTATCNAILKEDGERETPSMRDLPDFSVGKPYPGVKLQIRDAETLAVLGPNQRGEICLQSDGLFHSYLNNPQATQAAYVDGFYRTGDIGYYDTEGYVYVVDRMKEIFKYKGDHISPTELEDVIGKHPKVIEVCVIGVDTEGIDDQIPRAFVTVKPDSGPCQEVGEEIREFANAKLAGYKHIRGGVYVVKDLPKGKSGKITRLLVQKLPLPY